MPGGIIKSMAYLLILLAWALFCFLNAAFKRAYPLFWGMSGMEAKPLSRSPSLGMESPMVPSL